MKKLQSLIDRIISRVDICLREHGHDVGPYVRASVPASQLVKFYAFYGITDQHPLHFHFNNSCLSGSYFLGKCRVDNAVLYKCDIRGDELKAQGDRFVFGDHSVVLDDDEAIWIKDSVLIKTLVHNHSHDPEKLELFLIKNSVAAAYANIHGSPMEGCFLGPFATVDLTTLHDCVIGPYSYVQVGNLSHERVEAGRVWVRGGDAFDFNYRFPAEVLESRYIAFDPDRGALGLFMDLAEDRKTEFQRLYDVVHLDEPITVPHGASINRYSVFSGKSHVSENVLVAQRAFLENAWLGKGANAQENCYISYSRLAGFNVTAHGATIIYADMDEKVFVGFNSFLQGRRDFQLKVGRECIVMPHTIIDLKEPVTIPPRNLVWGYIRTPADLETHSIPLDRLSGVRDGIRIGEMTFEGDGEAFVHAFSNRIDHILQANGAFFDGVSNMGHAQKGQNISFNIVQPYPIGERQGLFPNIDINP